VHADEHPRGVALEPIDLAAHLNETRAQLPITQPARVETNELVDHGRQGGGHVPIVHERTFDHHQKIQYLQARFGRLACFALMILLFPGGPSAAIAR
jgi:hypothetical protein